MAALTGFDTTTGAATVSTPILAAATLLSMPIPAGYTIGGIDMDVSDLDANVAPVMTINVGDALDVDRFIAADTTARASGLLEYRPVNTAWYRYGAAANVLFTVGVAPATGAVGAISGTLFCYPSADVSDIVKRTLRNLGVLAEGETARSEDAAITLEAIADVHEIYRGKGIASRRELAWTVAAVPLFAARSYAALAADMLADTFGVSTQRAQRLAQRAAEGERELRRQTAVGTTGAPVSLEPYQTDDFELDYGQLV